MCSRAKVLEPESVGDSDRGEGGGDDHEALAVEGGPLRGLIRVRSRQRYIIYIIYIYIYWKIGDTRFNG